MMTAKQKVLNISISDVDFSQALAQFEHARFIVTPNIDHLYNLQKDKQFYDVYNKADLVLCDSKIISLIMRLLFFKKLDTVPGSTYLPAICRHYAGGDGSTLFLLGGTTNEHVNRAKANLEATTGIRIAGYYSPPFGFERADTEMSKIVQMIKASGATMVAVGVGSPKQEKVINHLLEIFPTEVKFIAVGAAIDFESGLVKRAPGIFQKLYLEWFYRFTREPKRMFTRYFLHDPQVLLLFFEGPVRPV